jgi:tripartite-type tricarboxylate transporter receptor subunit TctC
MTITRRHLLNRAAAAGAFVAAAPYVARAAAYPTQRITLINQFAPGSISDAAARLLAQSLQDQFGQPVIVENKVGAGGLVAAVAVARAAPDGYTLLATASSLHSGAALYKDLPIDPVKDFTHIARMGTYPSFIAVRSSLPVKSMAEFVAYAKANPGKLSYGYGNNMGRIIGEILKRRTHIDISLIPYRSNPAAVTDLLGGQIDAMLPDLNTGLAQVKADRIRPLAVATTTRNAALPEVPTLDSTVLPGFELVPWGGLSGPANLPPDVVTQLEAAARKTMDDPKTKELFGRSGIEFFWAGHDEFTAYVRDQLVNWGNLIREAGIPPE